VQSASIRIFSAPSAISFLTNGAIIFFSAGVEATTAANISIELFCIDWGKNGSIGARVNPNMALSAMESFSKSVK
jgi:hypothetical protein